MRSRPSLPTCRNHISVHDDVPPAAMFLQLKGPYCSSELIVLSDSISRLMSLTETLTRQLLQEMSTADPQQCVRPYIPYLKSRVGCQKRRNTASDTSIAVGRRSEISQPPTVKE